MAQTARKKTSQGDIDWIVFSYQSIRRWLMIFLVVVAGGVWGFYLYRRNHQSPQLRAQRQIEQAESALKNAQSSPEASRFTATLSQAKDRLNDAHEAYVATKYDQAYSLALEAESNARRALGRTGRSEIGDATFVALDGDVTLQRAGRGTWEECHIRQSLYDGDFVKTTKTGSAEIMFFDGTLYQLRPDSLFEVKTGQRKDSERSSAVQMDYGSIQVYTSNSPSSVKTKAVSAEIQRDSQVGVSIDPVNQNTDVANYRGQAVLRTDKESVVLAEREKVRAEVSTQSLGSKAILPDSPALIDPADNRIFDVRNNADILLRWTNVKDVVRYRLQVSKSRLFIPDATPLDLPNRTGLSASIRPHEEGSYYWRVAAINRAGVSSDWSPYRRFRIMADASRSGAPSGAPPSLTLQPVQQMANLFLVFGQTDPAASVSVNGKRADVEPNGSFKTTVSFDSEGESQIVVKATDAAGRETVKRVPVFVQIY